MTWQPDAPFNAIPLLPPTVKVMESIAVLKACIPARAALAELKQAGELSPNQGLLINLLPLLEAKDSSEIENIVTTSDKLFQYAQEDSLADPATKEALRYRTALYEGFIQLTRRPLCTNTAIEVCSRLKAVDMNIRKVPGTTLSNQATGEIIYTPPEGESQIRDLLSNWEQFLHAEDGIDPLIKMAIAHYQFEAIHPFTDGNGRTGRIINILYLIKQQLLTLPILYLTRYIVQHKSDYYRLLSQVTAAGKWEEWIIYMLTAVEQTAKWTTDKIAAVRELIEHASEYIKQSLPKIYSHELVQVIFEQPYCRISNLVECDIAKRQTASVYLKQLCDIGVLREIQAGKEKLFVHPKLVQLMTKDSNTLSYYTV
ncbi:MULTISPECIES: protein adenylyltransferase Fic [Photorhabdus]|uniref:protein adenylyltransferase Fic n=1 Tax=Photorhabdus TaxID=29487 RepID=UPI0007B4CCD4|nr:MULTISPECIES: Fic family protein [Photorhabdus]AWK44366.1 addiction module protein [Photorhabdus laumondii subsp. laumondii]AXG45092.1 addiction module protein [Photorhabdus laumondii subsp. laumondii]MCC8388218.1 Fic family protein [Photorhabdus laumondii]MCZ1248216.1 Fic family protein [Photorhabdus laumondii subsp. laumondii]NDL15844.1 Fic family protein [Photorhabdus laumondii subsp. laumondii]